MGAVAVESSEHAGSHLGSAHGPVPGRVIVVDVPAQSLGLPWSLGLPLVASGAPWSLRALRARLWRLGAAPSENQWPVMGLRNAFGDLGPRGKVGVGAPGGASLLSPVVVVEGVSSACICPGALSGMLSCLSSRRSCTTRLVMVL